MLSIRQGTRFFVDIWMVGGALYDSHGAVIDHNMIPWVVPDPSWVNNLGVFCTYIGGMQCVDFIPTWPIPNVTIFCAFD